MKFGEIYEFEYISKSKRIIDKKPRIILFAETRDKILGVNLNFLTSEARNGVVSIITKQMLIENPHRDEAFQEIIARQRILSDENIARILLMANKDDEERNDDEEDEKEDKKIEIERPQLSNFQAFRIMSKAMRVYNKYGINNLVKTKY